MSKSLEKIRDIKSLINEVYHDSKCQGELTEGARKSWLVFQQYCDDIKQDLELFEQLKQQRDSLAINNGELCVKVCKLEKENQELVVNKNLAQKLAVEYKNNIDKLEKENQEFRDKLNSQDLDIWQLHCKYEEYKKAIEIIKSKNVDIFFLRNNCEFDLEKYNYEIKDNTMQYCYENCLSLTQQEYELLKEVLKNE